LLRPIKDIVDSPYCNTAFGSGFAGLDPFSYDFERQKVSGFGTANFDTLFTGFHQHKHISVAGFRNRGTIGQEFRQVLPIYQQQLKSRVDNVMRHPFR